MQPATWFSELKRRRVYRALIGYGIVAFAVLQIVEPVMHGLNLPDWVLKLAVVGLGVGFPVTLAVAWFFDVREDRAPLPVLLLLIALAAGASAVGWYFWREHREVPPAGGASIAVLPFSDLSPARDQDWMCDGIAEEILDALFSVNGLRVAARSSSFQFKGKTAGVAEMAQVLGVSTLLEGSVRKSGERLRVSARLVSAEGYELWSEQFDRAVSDAFAIQDTIARDVVAALRLRMGPEQGAHRGTTDAQAYEMYLRGRQHLRVTGAAAIELGRQIFRRAIAIDPSFAEAHAALADAGATLLQWQLLPPADLPPLRDEVLAESEKALQLAPDLADAHVARANVLALLGRKDEAARSFDRAVELAPGSRDAWYYRARFLFSMGRYADAAKSFEQAAKTDPEDYDSLSLAAMPYARMGEPAKAVDALKRSLAAANQVLSTRPDDVRALYMSAGSLIQLGERDKGLQRFDQAITLGPDDYPVLYNSACGFARAGLPDKALDLLERAVGPGRGYRAWLENDPDLDSLRSSPRFQQILARLPQ
jgi:adenylate cyclase